jgi:hypothetical protein
MNHSVDQAVIADFLIRTKSPGFIEQLQLAGVLTSGFSIVPEHLYNIHNTPSENNNSQLVIHKVPNQITFLH